MLDFNRTNTNVTSGECYVVFKFQNLEQLTWLFLLSIVSVLFIFILIMNSSVILAIWKTKMIRLRRTETLFVMLSACDMLTGLTSLPLAVSQILFDLQLSCHVLAIISFFIMFPILFSALTTLVISFDRYLVINRGLNYTCVKKRMPIFVILDVIISVSLAGLFCYSSITYDYVWIALYYISQAIYLLMVLASNVAINTNIWLIVSKRTSRIPNMKSHCVILRRTIVTLIIWSMLCYLPIVTCMLIFGSVTFHKDKYASTIGVLVVWSFVPIYLNAGMNAFIYVIVNSKVKQFLVNRMEILLQHDRLRCDTCERTVVISACSHHNSDGETRYV